MLNLFFRVINIYLISFNILRKRKSPIKYKIFQIQNIHVRTQDVSDILYSLGETWVRRDTQYLNPNKIVYFVCNLLHTVMDIGIWFSNHIQLLVYTVNISYQT